MDKYVWGNKEYNKAKAIEHTRMVEKKYCAEVNSIASFIYTRENGQMDSKAFDKNDNMIIEVADMDSVSALYKYQEGRTAVLNFASYRHPGGRFIDGSQAQEEALCHESILYNVLLRQKKYYEWNEQNKNRGLYLNRMIFSKDILFLRDKQLKADVITCACPNKMSAQKYKGVTDEENSIALRDRIHFVIDAAATQYIDTLILGAYGCGVFGQNPHEVATIFKEVLNEKQWFNKVIFAVPKGLNDKNYKAFIEIFKR